jgi:hypothetical protein
MDKRMLNKDVNLDTVKLEAFELEQSAWKKLRAAMCDRLTDLRLQNDNNLSDAETAQLRGRIKEIKRWIEIDKPPNQAVTQTTNFMGSD